MTTKLPDGKYIGTWSGWTVRIKHEGVTHEYRLSQRGIRGTAKGLEIHIVDGKVDESRLEPDA